MRWIVSYILSAVFIFAMSSFGLEIFSQIFHLTLKFFPCYTILKFVGQDFYRNTPCVVSCPHP